MTNIAKRLYTTGPTEVRFYSDHSDEALRAVIASTEATIAATALQPGAVQVWSDAVAINMAATVALEGRAS